MRFQDDRRALQIAEAMLSHELPIAAALDALAAQSELSDEIQICGLDSILTEQSNQIRLFLSRSTLTELLDRRVRVMLLAMSNHLIY